MFLKLLEISDILKVSKLVKIFQIHIICSFAQFHEMPFRVDACPNINPYTEASLVDPSTINYNGPFSKEDEQKMANPVRLDTRENSRSRRLSRVDERRENARTRRIRETRARSLDRRSLSEETPSRRFLSRARLERRSLPEIEIKSRSRQNRQRSSFREHREDDRRSAPRENRSFLEAVSKHPKLVDFETLKQALVITLCAVYGGTLFSGKRSFAQ